MRMAAVTRGRRTFMIALHSLAVQVMAYCVNVDSRMRTVSAASTWWRLRQRVRIPRSSTTMQQTRDTIESGVLRTSLRLRMAAF